MQAASKCRLNNFIFFSLIIGIYSAAFFVQSRINLNPDVAWLLEASRRLLHGGNYTKDFFENNPPMILYLYFPAVLLNQFFSISIILAIRLYVFFIATVSLFICYDLMKRIFSGQYQVLSRPLLILLASIFLLLPFYELGQRDQLLLSFTMPYFLLAAYQLEGHSVKSRDAVVIGFLASLGFAMKPFFLIPLVLVEIYYIFCQKNLFAWFRDDVITIIIVITSYVTMVFLFNPDYIFLVAPYAWPWCRLSAQLPLVALLNFEIIYFCFLTILFYFIQYPTTKYKKLSTVLTLALIGFLLSYFLQKSSYLYRSWAAVSIAVFLCALLYGAQLRNGIAKKITFLTLWFFTGTLAGIIYYFTSFNTLLASQPEFFFAYFVVIFTVTLFATKSKDEPRSLLNIFGLVFIIALSSYCFTLLLRRTDLISYRFFFTMLFLFSLFGLCASKVAKRTKDAILMGFLGVVLFAIPLYHFYFLYAVAPKIYFDANLVNFLQKNAVNQSVYFFATCNVAFPYEDYYKNIKPVSRFSFFWMLGALVKEPYYFKDADPKRRLAGKNFLIDMVAEDLNTQKPTYVFVDVMQRKINLLLTNQVSLWKYDSKPIKFNYLTYFSENPNFVQAWKPYHYVTTIQHERLNEPYFDVYKRGT
ncbi:MAG: hypothetical protein V4501_10885 [Pseudomonadota bacterium]